MPSRTRVGYNNSNNNNSSNPWITAELRQLRLMEEEGFGSGDEDQLKESRYKFGRAVRDA